ncbi:MAG: SMC domain-containing protein, partial [bacterium]
MLIRKLQLKDIKNYTEKDFDFNAGVTAICGANGAGKTTIIESIAWALFDHLDYKREDFVRKGARKGSVNVFFISKLDGREYAVFRDSTGSYYVYDPVLNIRLAQQKQEVIKWLCQQHGVEPNTDLSILFRTTIGVPQGTFTYDFLQAPSKRKPVFDKILKVEEYFQAADELKDLLRLIERKTATIREQIASDEGELKRYEEVESAYITNTEKLLSIRTQYNDIKMEKDIADIRLSQLEKIKEKIDGFTSKIQNLKITIAEKLERERNLIEEIARAQQAANVVTSARKGYETYLSATENLNELEKQRLQRDKAQAAYTSTQQQLARLESNIQHLQ